MDLTRIAAGLSKEAASFRNEDIARMQQTSQDLYKRVQGLAAQIAQVEHSADRAMSADLKKAFKSLQSALRSIDTATLHLEKW